MIELERERGRERVAFPITNYVCFYFYDSIRSVITRCQLTAPSALHIQHGIALYVIGPT